MHTNLEVAITLTSPRLRRLALAPRSSKSQVYIASGSLSKWRSTSRSSYKSLRPVIRTTVTQLWQEKNNKHSIAASGLLCMLCRFHRSSGLPRRTLRILFLILHPKTAILLTLRTYPTHPFFVPALCPTAALLWIIIRVHILSHTAS